MAALKTPVEVHAPRASGLNLTISMPDKRRLNFRFSQHRAVVTDSVLLKVLMGHPFRNSVRQDTFSILATDEECENLIAEAEGKKKPNPEKPEPFADKLGKKTVVPVTPMAKKKSADASED